LNICIDRDCKVWSRVVLASESSNIDHMTPSPCLQARPLAPLSHATCRAFPLCVARILSSSALRICHLPPQITTGSTPSPSWPSHSACRTPKPTAQAHASPPSQRPTSKCKTPLLYVARVAHRPCASPLEVWTSSHFRRIAAGYGFAQDIRTLLLFPHLFETFRSPFFSFPIHPRPYHRARRLVSHPLTSARSLLETAIQ
jgi:hypothetical protein